VHKRKREEEELLNIEQALKTIYEFEEGGYSSLESKEALLQLEKNKRKLLETREVEWWLNSRAIWLENGDKNTRCFQAYAQGRNIHNTIWSLFDRDGNVVTSFE